MTLSLISLALFVISLSTKLSVKASDYTIIDPETKQPLPEENSPEGLGHHIGISPSSFNCVGVHCEAYMEMRYRSIYADVLIGVNSIRDKDAAEVEFLINNHKVWSDVVSPSNPASTCKDIGGPVRACLKVHNIRIEGENVHICFDISMQAFKLTLVKNKVGCVTVGRNGAHYSRS